MKNITVLGGGTAGWLTALYFKKIFPSSTVKIIYNQKVGIVGVGEATTPPFIHFIKFLGIDPYDALKFAGGTIKNGISFENWNGDNKKYFHPFKTCNEMNPWSLKPFFEGDCGDWYLKHLISKKLDFNEYVYPTKLAYKNKVDLNNVSFAVHFDTNKMSEYLELYGKKLGVEIINDNFKDVNTDDNGFITELILDHQRVQSDFVFDCSGFARLLIENHFKVKWKSYKKHLPMKSAIPFYLQNEAEIKPYTEAIALPHGWIWKIPLQHRIGSGYVFDSDYITPEQAKQEAENHLGVDLDVTRCIEFEAGRFEKYWVKNCIAIGLSSSFIEPLESSSIHMTIIQLKSLVQFINTMHEHQEKSVERYNKLCTEHMDEILYFVYLHYITKRKDSKFWLNFQNDYPVPEKYHDVLELVKANEIRYFDTYTSITNDNQFSLYSYLCVCDGLELFDKDINLKGYENLRPSINDYKYIIDQRLKQSITHNQFIKMLQEYNT